MRIRSSRMFIAVPALCLALLLGAYGANSFAQEKTGGYGKDDKKAPAGMPSEAEMQKMMMDMAKVGPEHKKLAEDTGTWDADVSFWMDPNAPPSKSKGTMKMEPMWDGRYMQMNFEGTMDMGGQQVPFQGMGHIGYDNGKQKYWSTWMDSMSTGLMYSEGNVEGNKVVMTGDMYDPMSKQNMKVRNVTTHVDKDHMTYEMFCPDPDGKEMRMMEIKYTRKT